MQKYKLLGWHNNVFEQGHYWWTSDSDSGEAAIDFPQTVVSTGEKDTDGFDVVNVVYKKPTGYFKKTSDDYSITWFIWELLV